MGASGNSKFLVTSSARKVSAVVRGMVIKNLEGYLSRESCCSRRDVHLFASRAKDELGRCQSPR